MLDYIFILISTLISGSPWSRTPYIW